jgi:hypothetical protein
MQIAKNVLNRLKGEASTSQSSQPVGSTCHRALARWRNFTLRLIFFSLSALRWNLAQDIDKVCKARNKANIPAPVTATSKKEVKQEKVEFLGFGNSLPRAAISKASGPWTEEPHACAHLYCDPGGNAHTLWWRCRSCGSRWHRVFAGSTPDAELMSPDMSKSTDSALVTRARHLERIHQNREEQDRKMIERGALLESGSQNSSQRSSAAPKAPTVPNSSGILDLSVMEVMSYCLCGSSAPTCDCTTHCETALSFAGDRCPGDGSILTCAKCVVRGPNLGRIFSRCDKGANCTVDHFMWLGKQQPRAMYHMWEGSRVSLDLQDDASMASESML